MTTITDVQHERYSDIVLKEWMKDIEICIFDRLIMYVLFFNQNTTFRYT